MRCRPSLDADSGNQCYFNLKFLFAVYIDDIAELFSLERGVRIVVYADDIILVTYVVC